MTRRRGSGEEAQEQGAADPAVAAALAAYAAGAAGEHAALTALAAARLLVPVVAVAAGDAGPGEEKTADMALPTLIGADGRPALLAFTCLDSLRHWRAEARPVPVPAARVWQAAAAETGAVVIDVAGPVPVAVAGPALAELAAGRPVPPPHADPRLAALAREALAPEPAVASCELLPGEPGTDLTLRLTLVPAPAPGGAIERVVERLMVAAGPALRRGVAVITDAVPGTEVRQ